MLPRGGMYLLRGMDASRFEAVDWFRYRTELDWKILSLVTSEILLSLGNGSKNISDEHFRIL